ncbi:glycosyl hydrolase [Niabella drilacis]|uniref:Glycosyl hydrolases family 2, sugar binding domain n=1 Tax=Niabella drilacis (strain DSM 25811 / CCM 8410 / CCUG 62505 / LMG 26954 / E90) TaxID=1285928 RepID=A0A1G6NL77_NIADE|nr:glycosyl hydrolase [Niabella drilacis]SDC68518.1 Glycosyl hydrolases family 2, sugar binding domain [Niabella drilacis]
MKIWIKSLLALLYLGVLPANGQIAPYNLQTSAQISLNQLSRHFTAPPPEARLRCYWWWLNSMATKASITRDLEEMKQKGYGGASLVDAGSSAYNVALKTAAGPVFMSPEWMELYRHAVKEADRLGIELSVNIQSGWNPGGPFVTPEYAMKRLVTADTVISGGRKIVMLLPKPPEKLMYRDVLVQAVRKPSGRILLRDTAIADWSLKTFNRSMGGSGIYPLYKFRSGFDTLSGTTPLQQHNIIDLTSRFDGRQLKWEAPPGEWIIIRYGWTNTGVVTSTTSDGWNGLSLDHLSPAAFNLFNRSVITPLITAAKEAGNSVRYLQTDSWEMGVVNWTQDFPKEFRARRGYDILRFMPVLAGYLVESQEQTNRFLYDFRKTVGDCILDNHYRLFYNTAHQGGMGIHPESGGPHSAPIDALQVMGINDFPQGEFWAMANTHRVSDAARLAVKQSACVAHTNGKRFVGAEGPTSIGPQWERSPRDLKSNIDRIFCSGVNRIVWHTFTSSPKEFGLPGNEYFAGTHMNPNVTWWNDAAAFTGYLNRASYLLQQGLFTADVLYYYGDDVPNFVFLKEEFPQLHFGYDWDKCSRDVVLKRLSVKNGRIVLPDGMQYRLLALPSEKAISLDVLKKIEALVKEGMTVWGPRPAMATGLTGYPGSDGALRAIADRLWGKIDGTAVTENRYGKGTVIWGKDINAVLKSMEVMPDLSFTSASPQTAIDYIHRNSDEADIYFLSNRFEYRAYNDFEYRYLPEVPDRYEQIQASFRISGRQPQLWDALSGTITDIVYYREENGRTIIPLHFEPGGSKFIVFKKENAGAPHITGVQRDGAVRSVSHAGAVPDFEPIAFNQQDGTVNAVVYEKGHYTMDWSDGRTTTLNATEGITEKPLAGSWQLKLDARWGGGKVYQLNALKSWTAFEDPDLKYYSGKGVYTTRFRITEEERKGRRILLDLGNVQDLAEIKVNGVNPVIKWCFPYRIDITEAIKPGINTLSVGVVNLWANRLIGDRKLPAGKRLTKTNVIKFETDEAEKLLRISGLLGPAQLLFVPELPVKTQ